MAQDVAGIPEGGDSQIDWRERDSALLAWLRVNVAGLDEIERTGAFGPPSKSARTLASRRIKKLRERSNGIRIVGQITEGKGRPKDIYYAGRNQPKQDQLFHEILVTRFLLDFASAVVTRGPKVNQRYRADAELVTDSGNLLYVELFTGSQSYRQYKKRAQAYRWLRKGFVVWVALTEGKMHALRERGGAAPHCFLWTVLGSKLWFDYEGNARPVDELDVGFHQHPGG